MFFSLFKKEKENQIVAKNAQPRYVQRSIKSEAVFMKAVDVGHSKAKSFQDIHVYIHILYILYIIYYIYVLKYVNVLDYCAELLFPFLRASSEYTCSATVSSSVIKIKTRAIFFV